MRRLLPALPLLGALWAGSALAQLELPEAQGRPVVAVEVANQTLVRDGEILDLFGVAPGDAYDVGRVRLGLSRLAQKDSIRNVVVRGQPEGAGVTLRLEVTPEPLVRSLLVRGNRALSDRELVARLQTRVDHPVRDPVLTQDIGALRELYESEGYPDARVHPRVESWYDPRWLVLTLEVDEGEPLRVVRVEGDAAPAMERERMLALLGLREGSPASRRRLREGVRRLVDALHREGYPEARSGRPSFRPEAGGAALILPLTVGEAVDLRVEGLDEWAAAPLREVARGRFGEPIDGAWVERTAELMVEHLRGQGYRGAAVEGEETEAYGRRRVVFRVRRGPRVRVREVVFQGNESISSERLRGYLSVVVGGFVRPPPFTREALDRDLDVLVDYYASRGFLDCRVAVLDLSVAADGAATLRLQVDEGRRYLLGRVEVEGDGALEGGELEATRGLVAGAPADPGEVAQARVRLLRELEKRGYPDAEVSVRTDRRPEAGLLDATYRVVSGPRVWFGKAVVSGNARTQTRVISRELALREGNLWDQQQVLESRQRIYRLGFFQRVRLEPASQSPQDGPRDVRVEVEEQDAGSVTFGLGYGTEEGVKGFAAVSHANLWGSGRSLGARYDFDQFDRSRAVNFREPWLLGHPYALGLSLVSADQNREAYNLSSLAFQARLEREFSERLHGSLLYTLEDNQLDDVVDEEVLGEAQVSAYLLSALGPVLVWDSRDDPFNPHRGFHHTFQAEWATDALGSEVQYERYLGTASGFFSVGDVTLALLARGGIAVRLGAAAELPVNKRFFLGGRSTVRGFQKDEVGPRSADGTPVGGDVMANLKAELRFPVWKRLAGAIFWDAGNVWNRAAGFPGSAGLRHGAGGGLRYLTPVGPISFDLGFNLERQEDEDPYVWYFTIGNVF